MRHPISTDGWVLVLGGALFTLLSACAPDNAPRRDAVGELFEPVKATAKLEEPPAAVGQRFYRRSVAVVIGVDNYARMSDLKGAERDARTMARALRRRGFAVRTLLGKEVTRQRVAGLLGDELPATLRRDDRLLIYFAGHGVSQGEGPAAGGYLMTAGADRARPAATGIAMTELLRWFGRYPAKHVMLLADACYSGLALSTRGAAPQPAMNRYLRAVTSRRTRVVLVAGGSGQQAHEWRGHGLFTYFLLRALDGAADANHDGVTTSDELVAYVKPEVARTAQRLWGSEQEPQSARTGQGEFVFFDRPLDGGPTGNRVEKGVRGAAGPPTAAPVPTPAGWVRVEPGAFVMGTPAGRKLRDDDEHEVAVHIRRPLLMQTTEVTQAQWQAVMGGPNPATFAGCGPQCPVEEISFWDALAYANARSRKEGLPACYELHGCDTPAGGTGRRCRLATFHGIDCRGYRLPTEEEWEYAARAGTTTDTYAGDLRLLGRRHAPVLDAIARHGGHNTVDYPGAADCSGWGGRGRRQGACGTSPVGGLRANAWGLHDMIGNVWEWVWSRPIRAAATTARRRPSPTPTA